MLRLVSCTAAVLLLALGGAQAAPKTYDNPTFRGYTINTCTDDSKAQCGQAAADKFCQSQTPACARALSFSTKDVSTAPTFQVGDNKVKAPGQGGSFSQITCDCQAIAQRFDSPRVDGQLVDFCLRKAGETGGTDCGGPAADAFCRQQGYAKAAGFLIKPNAPEVTKFIGDGQQHNDPGRAGFEYIECGN